MGIMPMYPNTPIVKFFNIKNAIVPNNTPSHANTIIGLSGGVNGVRLDNIKLQSVGNNIVTKMKIWFCHGPNMMITENCFLLKEILLPKTDASDTVEMVKVEDIKLDIVIPSDCLLLFSLDIPVENGWDITIFGAGY